MSQPAVPVDLRSDTVTRPTPEMRRVMAEAEVGDDVYGEDPSINLLQERVAELLGKEAALFVPSGVMANQLAVQTHTTPGDEVLIHVDGHILNYEGGSAAALAGVQLHPLPGKDGVLDPREVWAGIRPPGEHFARTRLLALENTHNRAGGTVWPLERLEEVAAVGRAEGVLVHLDGARLWNASVAAGVAMRDYAAPADSVSVCFSKGLGAPVGSALAGSAAFIEAARAHRKRYGGAMRQAGILAAGALYAMDHHVDRLALDHEHAVLLAGHLAQVPGVFIPHPVQTNIVIVDVESLGRTAEQVVTALAAVGVLCGVADRCRVRFVTHLDVSAEQVQRAADAAVAALEAFPASGRGPASKA